mmetsp:Transcript_7848/g.28687  ORF Transcript_7848/g.28687 Transcript_7848/m.28687 type:complete len:271 (-) Transcript_7848:1045-1857(-)
MCGVLATLPRLPSPPIGSLAGAAARHRGCFSGNGTFAAANSNVASFSATFAESSASLSDPHCATMCPSSMSSSIAFAARDAKETTSYASKTPCSLAAVGAYESNKNDDFPPPPAPPAFSSSSSTPMRVIVRPPLLVASDCDCDRDSNSDSTTSRATMDIRLCTITHASAAGNDVPAAASARIASCASWLSRRSITSNTTSESDIAHTASTDRQSLDRSTTSASVAATSTFHPAGPPCSGASVVSVATTALDAMRRSITRAAYSGSPRVVE